MNKLQTIITRIASMEQCFDEVLEMINNSQEEIYKDVSIRKKLQVLSDYYENGLWLHDYECDEKGELPDNLKRGVLSEDALYNLLSDIEWKD